MAPPDFIRHVGRVDSTGSRIVVVFRQLPDELENALIVFSDALSDRYHDELMSAIESVNAQSGPDLFPWLQRQRFSDGIPMLEALHRKKLLHKHPTDKILMTPRRDMVIKLDELNVDLKDIDWGGLDQQASTEKPGPSAVDTYAVQPGDHAPASATSAGETALSDSDIAAQRLTQATSLEEEAKRLRDEAYDYDPNLKPKRGRPKKTS
jgi:hypothetical protein